MFTCEQRQLVAMVTDAEHDEGEQGGDGTHQMQHAPSVQDDATQETGVCKNETSQYSSV